MTSREQLILELQQAPDDLVQIVLDFLHRVQSTRENHPLAKFVGTLSDSAAKEIEHTIASECDTIDLNLNAEVEDVFRELGLSATEAITLFYHQVKLQKRLPFEAKVPNKTTEQTFKTTDAGQNLTRCDDVDEMFKLLGL